MTNETNQQLIKYYLHHPIFSLLLVFCFFTSCNGQVKTESQTGILSQPQIFNGGQPKLISNHFGNQSQAEAGNVHCGLQDKAGNLWFGTTGDGVYRYDGKLFINFKEKDGLNNNSIWCMKEDKAGNIWFGTGSGICRFDGKNFTNIPITVSNGSNLPTYIPPSGGLSKKNSVWCMLEDKNGILWFGTDEGVYCYDGISLTRFLDNDSIINKNGFHLKRIESILEDKSGNIWFASWADEGVLRFDGKSITNVMPPGPGRIRCFLEDTKGTIWLSYLFKVSRYDGSTFKNFTEKKGLGFPLLADKSGNIWFSGGDWGSGHQESPDLLWCYDGKSFKNYTAKDGLDNYGVWCMVEDTTGNLWIGTRNTGLFRFDGKTFTKFSE